MRRTYFQETKGGREHLRARSTPGSRIKLGTELYLETVTLFVRPPTAVSGVVVPNKRVRVSSPKFGTILLFRVRVSVISGYDVIINMCTALRCCYFFI